MASVLFRTKLTEALLIPSLAVLSGLLLGSLLFGGVDDALAVRLQNVTDIPPSLIQFLPNVLAIVALVLVALRSRGLEA